MVTFAKKIELIIKIINKLWQHWLVKNFQI